MNSTPKFPKSTIFNFKLVKLTLSLILIMISQSQSNDGKDDIIELGNICPQNETLEEDQESQGQITDHLRLDSSINTPHQANDIQKEQSRCGSMIRKVLPVLAGSAGAFFGVVALVEKVSYWSIIIANKALCLEANRMNIYHRNAYSDPRCSIPDPCSPQFLSGYNITWPADYCRREEVGDIFGYASLGCLLYAAASVGWDEFSNSRYFPLYNCSTRTWSFRENS